MPATNELILVTFRIDSGTWKAFLKDCRNKDMSGSQVLRNYINLIVTKKIPIAKTDISEYRDATQPGP